MIFLPLIVFDLNEQLDPLLQLQFLVNFSFSDYAQLSIQKENAVEQLKIYLRTRPDDYDALFNLSSALIKTGDYVEVLSDLGILKVKRNKPS